VTCQTQPENVRAILLSKKSSAAVVSSWGFSGYITVLPKENKPACVKQEKEESPEKAKSAPQVEPNRS
jgi:hypothetical protein